MAAGLIKRTVTLKTGEDVEIYFWAADTGVDDDDLTPAKVLLDQDGNPVEFASLGPATSANSNSMTPASDLAPGVAVSITRTNDTNAYNANDVIGAATGSTACIEFANMGLSGRSILINRATLRIDASAIISGETSYNLYCYGVTAPSAIGDNGAFDIGSGDRASFLGKIPLGTPVDEGSTLFIEQEGLQKQFKLTGTSVFAYLVTVGGYTPTAQRVYTVGLHAVQL